MPHLTPTTRSLILWISTASSAVFCLFRLWLRRWRGQRFTQGDYWVMLALPFIALNAGSEYFVSAHYTPLELLTKGQETAEGALAQLPPQQRAWLGIAAKLDVTHRVAFCIVLWSLKMAVLDLLRSLLQRLWYYREIFHALYCILGVTFIAAFVSAFLECTPMREYWQVDLDFDACKKPDVWITTYECGNILTDLLLLLIPFPIIFKAHISYGKRIRLSVVFGLSFFLVGVNVIRLYRGLHPWGLYSSGRLLWSSVELAVAAVVATSPTIYILARPSFHRRRREEVALAAAAKKRRQDSAGAASRSCSKAEISYEGDARGGPYGLPRRPSTAHYHPLGPRLSRIPSDMRDDSWGRGPWSGGHQSFSTQITSRGGGSNGGSQSRGSADDDDHASSGIMVRTVVEQEVVDISEMTELASFVTPPLMVHNSLV